MKSKKFASIDSSICVCCGACFSECPMSAISSHGGSYMEVNKDICVGCGKCERICPAGCISLTDIEK